MFLINTMLTQNASFILNKGGETFERNTSACEL